MIALFSALGVDLPEAGTVIATRTIIVSMLVGTAVTVLASILPARRATRVPPIAAVREGSTPAAVALRGALGQDRARRARSPRWRRSRPACSPAASSGAAMALLLAVGVLGLFVGIALLAPRLVKPLARVVGWPARRAGGVAGDLAGANAVRNPGRTASTAAALMIGLTLVTVVAVLGAGITAGTKKAAISDQIHADYVVDGNEGLPFRADEGDKLAATPGVKAASHVRADQALVQGKENTVTGIDPATIARFYTFEWTTRLRAHARAARDRRRARDQGLRQGPAPEGRQPRVADDAVGRQAHARRARHLRPAVGQRAARRRQHVPAGVRQGVRQPEEQVHVPRRDADAAAGAEGRGQGLRRRQAPHRRRVPEGRHQGHGRSSWRCSTCCSASRWS